jgi:membrane-bound lytic murein transglycosylase MltF
VAMRLFFLLVLTMLALVTSGNAMAGARGKSGAPEFRTEYDEYFRKYAKHYFGVGADWSWFKAQAVAESNLNPGATSFAKAKGVMQLMPATYAELQKKNPDFGAIDEPRWNIAAGISYDRLLWNRLRDLLTDNERRRFMFGANNAGATTIARARRLAKAEGQADHEWQGVSNIAPKVPQWRHRETLSYVSRIEAVREKLRSR